jgi:HNH endonuclease
VIKTPWRPEEVATLRQMYDAGESDEAVAVVLSRSVWSVKGAKKQYRVLRRREAMRCAPPWSESELARFRALYAAGVPNSTIADAMGRTRIAIKRYVTGHGLKRDPSALPEPSLFDTPTERWRPSVEPGYAVSSLGRVMSLRPGKVGLIMRMWRDDEGYEHVTLTRDNVNKRRSVHQLVAEAFLGSRPSPAHEVAHEDGKPWHNVATNLRWATEKENQRDRLRHGTALRTPTGQFLPCRKPVEAADRRSGGAGTARAVEMATGLGVPVRDERGWRP